MRKKARFIGGDLFWSMLLAYRTVWYMGRFGAGKTSLAVICAARLLAEKRVEKIVSNIPLTFGTPLPAVPLDDNGEIVYKKVEKLLDAGILIDEAWQNIEDKQSTTDYAAFVRKFNHYLLMPSVFPINLRLSYFYVQRVFNGYGVGLPMWFYKWNINNRGIKEQGYFAVANPTAIFTHYPTDFTPGDDGNISDTLIATAMNSGFTGTRKQRKTKGKKQVDNEDKKTDFPEVEAMEDLSAEIGEYVQDLYKTSKNLKRR